MAVLVYPDIRWYHQTNHVSQQQMNDIYARLNGAYGNAVPLIAIISGLWSENEDEQQDAINEGLWGWACHQYTMYSVTPFVLLDILNNLSCIKASPSEVIQFIKLCNDYGNDKIIKSEMETDNLCSSGIQLPDMQKLIFKKRCEVLTFIERNGLKTQAAFSLTGALARSG
jgi:hypothetical protein